MALLVVAALLVSCSGGGTTPPAPTSTPASPDISVSPSPSPTRLVSSPPLATVDAIEDDGSELVRLARSEGTLRITEHCVTINGPGLDQRTVLWTEGRVSFDGGANTIAFLSPDLDAEPRPLILRDGDHVVFGGGGGEEPFEPYVRPPHESCPPDIWHAQLVELVED